MDSLSAFLVQHFCLPHKILSIHNALINVSVANSCCLRLMNYTYFIYMVDSAWYFIITYIFYTKTDCHYFVYQVNVRTRIFCHQPHKYILRQGNNRAMPLFAKKNTSTVTITSIYELVYFCFRSSTRATINGNSCSSGMLHDDVIKRKHFLCYWLFVREFTGAAQRSSNAELWFILLSAPEQMVE